MQAVRRDRLSRGLHFADDHGDGLPAGTIRQAGGYNAPPADDYSNSGETRHRRWNRIHGAHSFTEISQIMFDVVSIVCSGSEAVCCRYGRRSTWVPSAPLIHLSVSRS